MYKKSIYWFRRDLRIHDNTALYNALSQSETIIPVFIFDTNIIDTLDTEDRRISFIWESLLDIQSRFQTLGSELLIYEGNPTHIIPQIIQKSQAEALFYNEDYEIYAMERDTEIQSSLNNINIHSFRDHIIFAQTSLLTNKGSAFKVYTPYKNCWLKTQREERHILDNSPSEELLTSHKVLPNTKLDNLLSHNINDFSELKQFKYQNNNITKGGTTQALKRLTNFLHNNINQYGKTRDIPALDSTSHLSVDLRFGTLSTKECLRMAFFMLEQANNSEHIQCWINELIWREFHFYIMYHFPHSQTQPFLTKYNNFPWKESANLLDQWKNAQTGIPIVDAGMRELQATGFMHNRVRMITASFLCKNLLVHWKLGERVFAQHLLDYEFASNNGNWQWVASVGVDASPYFRVFNPLLQSAKFDPEAQYIKKWLPELQSIDPKLIHHNKIPTLLTQYPEPIIDLKQSRMDTISLFTNWNNLHK